MFLFRHKKMYVMILSQVYSIQSNTLHEFFVRMFILVCDCVYVLIKECVIYVFVCVYFVCVPTCVCVWGGGLGCVCLYICFCLYVNVLVRCFCAGLFTCAY